MMRIGACVASLLVCAGADAQTYSTDAIVARADSILLAAVGPGLHPYFSYDTDSYYEYRNRRGRSDWEQLNARQRTRGQFVGTNVRFRFRHPDYPWIIGPTSVRFDSTLAHIGAPNFSYLPPFLREGRASDFISGDSALAVALALGIRTSERPPTTDLLFVPQTGAYEWQVLNVYDERKWGNGYGADAELVRVHPVTGEVLAREEVLIARPNLPAPPARKDA